MTLNTSSLITRYVLLAHYVLLSSVFLCREKISQRVSRNVAQMRYGLLSARTKPRVSDLLGLSVKEKEAWLVARYCKSISCVRVCVSFDGFVECTLNEVLIQG